MISDKITHIGFTVCISSLCLDCAQAPTDKTQWSADALNHYLDIPDSNASHAIDKEITANGIPSYSSYSSDEGGAVGDWLMVSFSFHIKVIN